MKYLLKGVSGTGKTSLLRESCIYLNEKLGIPAASILVILADNERLSFWNSVMSEKTAARFRYCTFSAFVREELTLYYPLALSNYDCIMQKDIKPVFLSSEASIHLISKVVQARREKDGLFTGLVSSNERIAAVLANNLKAAALECIPAEEIGGRLYEALDRKDKEKEQIFKDMDEIGLAYRKRCLELGVLDYSMALELYRKFLLQDEKYRQSLCSRFKHIVIDDLQETSHAMLELVELLMESCDTAFLGYDPEFGSAGLLRGNRSFPESKVSKACEVIELEKPDKSAFAEALYSAILKDAAEAIECGFRIERSPAVELRSEMLELLAYKICTLVNEDGLKPSDIVILSTYGDVVTELVINNILRKNGITLVNAGARMNAADSPLCSGLLAFARLCHPDFCLYPEKGTVKQMIQQLFGLDPVRSSKIARKTCNTFPFPNLPDMEEILPGDTDAGKVKEKYDYVRIWVTNYKGQEKPMNMSAFLQLSLMEIFLDGTTNEEEIFKAKLLVDTAERFCNATVKFGRNTGRDFIEMAENILKAGESPIQPEGGMNCGSVVLTTPEAYISSPINNKVLIISGLSSGHWSRGRGSELSNPQVLSASWDRGTKYTREMEERNSRCYLASMMRAVLEKGSSRVIAFESLRSESGFENDGILPEILDKIQYYSETF